MAPNLSIEGKRALMEQSLKFVSNPGYGFTIWLQEHATGSKHEIRTTAEKAIRLVHFLNPKTLAISQQLLETEEFVECIKKSNCNIAMYDTSNLLMIPRKHIWPRITEIHIDEYQVLKLRKLPKKSFDGLEVHCIVSLDQLQGALRQNAKKLILGISSILEEDDFSGLQNFVPGKIKHCKVFLNGWISKETTLSFLRNIVNLLKPSLSHLEIVERRSIYSHDISLFPHCHTPKELAQYLINNLEELTGVLNEANISLKVTTYYICTGTMDFEANQSNTLKTLSLEGFQLKVGGGGDPTIYLKREIGKTKIEFNAICLKCHH